MEQLEPLAGDPGGDDEPTDWQATLVKYLMTINHELGCIQADVGWIKTALKVIAILVIALIIVHGPELWRWILSLLT